MIWGLIATWRPVLFDGEAIHARSLGLTALAVVGMCLLALFVVKVTVDTDLDEVVVGYPFRPGVHNPLEHLERVGRGPLGSGVVVIDAKRHLVAAGDSKGFVEFARSCQERLGVDVDDLDEWPQGLPLTRFDERGCADGSS